jgi:hypothetical protein
MYMTGLSANLKLAEFLSMGSKNSSQWWWLTGITALTKRENVNLEIQSWKVRRKHPVQPTLHPKLKRFMRGLTQAQGAHILDVKVQTLWYWLNGREPSRSTLRAIDFFFNMSVFAQEKYRREAREACPNKGGRVY